MVIVYFWHLLLFVNIINMQEIKLKLNTTCSCIPFYQCTNDENGVVISDGRGLLEIRKSDTHQLCDGYFDVCCDTSTPKTTPEPPQQYEDSNSCGTQSPQKFPWSASLLYNEYTNFQPAYKCGISLIHPQVALTAAHCVVQNGYYFIKIKNTLRPIDKAIIHPEYKKHSLQNDLAILFLLKPMYNVEIVCLPPPGSFLDSTNCTAGTYIKEKESDVRETIKIINLPIISREQCVNTLKKTRLGQFFQLHYSFICAGGNNADTCGGDGGSPLICPIPGLPGRYQQVGIVSWGIGCSGKIPGVYVNLAIFRNWIDKVLLENGFGTNSYRY